MTARTKQRSSSVSTAATNTTTTASTLFIPPHQLKQQQYQQQQQHVPNNHHLLATSPPLLTSLSPSSIASSSSSSTTTSTPTIRKTRSHQASSCSSSSSSSSKNNSKTKMMGIRRSSSAIGGGGASSSSSSAAAAGFVSALPDVSYLMFFVKVVVTAIVFWSHFGHAFPIVQLPTTATTTTTIPTSGVRIRSQQQLRPTIITNTATSPSLSTTKTMTSSSSSSSVLFAGFGTATPSTSKKSKKKTNKKKANSGSGSRPAGGATDNGSTTTTPFDVNASLMRLEKKFDELTRQAAKQLHEQSEQEAEEEKYGVFSSSSNTDNNDNDDDFLTSEFIVAARAASNSKSGLVPDWVPIAQLCLKRKYDTDSNDAADADVIGSASDPMVHMAISAYRRELSHVAKLGAPAAFATLARNDIQYSAEPIDSFHKHVYDEVIDGQAKKQETNEAMTKSEARSILQLDSPTAATTDNNNKVTIDKAAIKQAYRKLSFQLHPDRFEGTPDECDQARIDFGRVQLAYETLSSGIRGDDNLSWYESLGGRARTGFVGPINLLPLSAAQDHLQRHGAESGLFGLDPDLTLSFVARNVRSE